MTTPPAADSSSIRARFRAGAIPVVIVLAAGLILFAKTRHYEMLGWDSYPIVASTCTESVDDFIGLFTEPLMVGRFPSDFYRPVVNVSFALDYALWGLSPVGYQLTNLLLFCACALFLWALMKRCTGRSAAIAPTVTLLVFLFHPTHWEVIPVPARRAELLCGWFILWGLWWQLSPRALARVRFSIAPVVLAMLALASKETGVILPALVVGAVCLFSPRTGWRHRFLHGLRASAPYMLGMLIVLIARFIVLDGVGNFKSMQLSRSVVRIPRIILDALIFPQAGMDPGGWAGWLGGLVAVGLILAVVLAVVDVRERGWKVASAADAAVVRSSLLALGMLVFLVGIYSMAGRMRSWYLFLPVMSLAMVAGAACAGLACALRSDHVLRRVSASVTLVALAGLFTWQARYSPLVFRYDEWERASKACRYFLDEVKLRVDGAKPGSLVEAPPMPRWVEPGDPRAGVYGGQTLSRYTVQAWADLAFHDRRVRIVPPRIDPAIIEDDEVIVRLTVRWDHF